MIKERLLWLDFLKLIAIYLVVWGHVIRHCGLSINDWDSVCGWIYSFHMPLFMSLSGFVSYKLLDGNYNIKRKFRQLIIPCIFLWIICIIVGHNENFWYLKSLFACYVITALLYSVKFRYKWIIFFLLCAICFPVTSRLPFVGTWKIDFMLPYFIMGMYLNKFRAVIAEHINMTLMLSLVSFVILWYYWTPKYIYYNSPPIWFEYKCFIDDSYTFLHLEAFLQTIYRLVIGIFGTLFFVCATIKLFSLLKNNKSVIWLSQWGMYSLHIYIIQSFIVQSEILPISFPIENKLLFFAVYTPIYSALVVCICVLLGRILEKNKFLNKYLFGKG